MDAQTILRTNGAKAGELVGAIGGAAEALARAIEDAAGPVTGKIEGKAGTLVKMVEVRAVPLAGAVGATVETLAQNVEERAAPVVEAIGTRAESVAEGLGETIERTSKSVLAGVKNFKFGKREGVLLGLTLGLFATVWLASRVDRRAAARTLRSAGSRVGEATQTLPSRAGALAGQAGERAGQVAQAVGARANQVVQQVRGGQDDKMVDTAKSHLSDATAPVRDLKPKADFASDLDKDTLAAIDEAAREVQRAEDAAIEAAPKLGLSNGMKVVAFDGTDIGRVQEVREGAFVLDRPRAGDLLVPLTEIARIEGTVAYLRIDVGQLTKMGWDQA